MISEMFCDSLPVAVELDRFPSTFPHGFFIGSKGSGAQRFLEDVETFKKGEYDNAESSNNEVD